jgi:hypothetical protein
MERAARTDRLAAAFREGYAAALRALVPGIEDDEIVALCATEAGGAHPRAILTELREGRLTGTKSYVTGGTEATRLLVVAREPSGTLRLVSVGARAPGVTVTAHPPAPFVPELPHASVTFDGAAGEVLPGDGYADYLKPFRTVEDIHVLAATAGYLEGLGRRAGWTPAARARLAAIGVLLEGLAARDPRDPTTHVALEGALALARQVFDGCDFDAAPEDERARWRRDRPLLEVAGKVRALRFEAASRAIWGST